MLPTTTVEEQKWRLPLCLTNYPFMYQIILLAAIWI